MAHASLNETHVSWVFLVGDRAYKLKKPVRLAFLDFSTVEKRRAACEREVALNRRLAPDVYLGVDSVVDERGHVLDHLVVMRRMPDERRLSAALGRECVAAVAQRMASFHAAAARSPEIDSAGSVAAMAAKWDANTEELRRLDGAGGAGVADDVEEVHRLAHRYLAGRSSLFVDRIAVGCMVDGHGDLLADDVFCLDDGPRILDCLEFDDRLRWGDALADIAFLAMDLERLGRLDLADQLLAEYRAVSGDDWPASLAHHYIAHRAQIRAKVALLRGDEEAGSALLGLALRHLRAGAVRMVLVGGLPGTGKTTVAAALSERLGWRLLRSDVVRGRARVYTPEAVAATYARLLGEAARAMAMGESVVLDATWSDAGRRCEAFHVAAAASADVVEVLCQAPMDVALARIAGRVADESDATADVAVQMAARFAPWPRARVVDTVGPVDAAVAEVEALCSS